jgi:hypothetical protein
MDVILDINKFNADNIVYQKPLNFYTISKNLGLHYDASDDLVTAAKQKIIVRTPKMLIPFDIKEFDNGRKCYKLRLSFTTMTNIYNEDEIKKFYNYVKSVDKKNKDTIKSYVTKWGLPKDIKYKSSLSQTSTEYPECLNVNLPFDPETGYQFGVYDEFATKSNVSIINRKCIVSAIIEITDMWFGEKEFGTNWNVIQIRKFSSISPIQQMFMNNCYLLDDNEGDMPTKSTYNPSNTTSIGPIGSIGSNVPAPPPAPPVKQYSFRPPSQEQILSQIGKLRKPQIVEIPQELLEVDVIPDPEIEVEKKPRKDKKKKSREKNL